MPSPSKAEHCTEGETYFLDVFFIILFIKFVYCFCAINLFYLLLIIGPVEEMIFRLYYQNTFISFFKKYKWIGIIIASIIFGLFHIFNGWISVLITFGIGLIFGFSKEYIKDIHYPGISFAHGLYDLFLRVITYIF